MIEMYMLQAKIKRLGLEAGKHQNEHATHFKKVQVGRDQDKAQSGKDSYSKTDVRKKLRRQQHNNFKHQGIKQNEPPQINDTY